MSGNPSALNEAIFEALLRLGDDRLVLGHRVSEWCGHGPLMEEDLALANIALDLIGQARNWLDVAAKLRGDGTDADALAFLRDPADFRNLALVELPRGDFAFTIARQFLFDAFDLPLMEAWSKSSDPNLRGIAAKSLKEARYHLRHSSQWVVRLGDGTAESHDRIAGAFEALWGYGAEMFLPDSVDQTLFEAGIGPDLAALRAAWEETIVATCSAATLSVPSPERYQHRGSRQGRHTEHLGHLLAEMQVLPRSYPGATW